VSGAPFLASFDIEDWFHPENVRVCLGTPDWNALEGRVERNTHALLDLLAGVDAHATFFVLGWVARRYPGLVRRIAEEGHEVASHTDMHHRLNLLSRRELAADLLRARDSLEQVTGERVLGVRAPNFSISDEVLECMAEAGFWYDSSFFSVRAHARYGRLSADVDPEASVAPVGPRLLELPLSRLQVAGTALPWAGGAYFRLIPYPVYRLGVARRLRTRAWFMFYFHPWELDAAEAPPPSMPLALRLRAYAGRRRTPADLRRLLAEFGTQRIDHTLLALGHTPPPR
jgi:polysaccharide deacetylase family protein (PEP-CTERM system associated)